MRLPCPYRSLPPLSTGVTDTAVPARLHDYVSSVAARKRYGRGQDLHLTCTRVYQQAPRLHVLIAKACRRRGMACWQLPARHVSSMHRVTLKSHTI